jgi:hypothetical protein
MGILRKPSSLSWAPYSFEEKEHFRNALWAAVEELLREGHHTERSKSA